MVSHWSLRDSKSLQVSRTLLSILADLNNEVAWIVLTRPLISKSSSPFNIPSVPVPITIGINVTFMFHSFFNFLERSKYLFFFLFSFNFTLWSAETAKSTIIIIIFIIVYSYQLWLMVFHWSLSDSKSPQVSRTLLSILAVLNNAVVWMVSTRLPTSKPSSNYYHYYCINSFCCCLRTIPYT